MEYDRDSFLSGLAVGRVLWRPYRDNTRDIPIVSIPCFQSGNPVDVEFIRYYYGDPRTFYGLDVNVSYPELFTRPFYWFTQGGPNGFWVLCTDDTAWSGDGTSTVVYGIDENEEPVHILSTYSPDVAVSGRGFGTHFFRCPIPKRNYPYDYDFSNFFERWPEYYTGMNIQGFLNSAHLVDIGGQLYLIGVDE